MNLRHIRLILKREYTQRLRSPGFIIGTIMGVVGIVALAFLPTILKLLDQQDTVKVAVVDPQNLIYRYLPFDTGPAPTPVSVPTSGPSQNPLPLTTGVKFSKADTTDEQVLSNRVTKGDITAYVVVQGSKPSEVSFIYHSKEQPGATNAARLTALLSAATTQARLDASGITPAQAQALFTPPTLKVAPIVGGALKDEKSYVQSSLLAYALLVLLYVTMLMYGIQVAMGVVEEKSSRVMEVLITAVRPIELMLGKVLGIGLVGLTQYGAWVGMGLIVFIVSSVFGKSSSANIDVTSVPAATLIFFLVFFVLGYLLFACIYAALGSLVNRSEEVNSVTTPLTLIMVANYLIAIWALGNPEATLVRWLSFVPIFTPMLMFIRVALSHPDWWELLLSVLLLAGASLLFAWIAARIYRIGVLLYGKRPSFREIGRLLRTA